MKRKRKERERERDQKIGSGRKKMKYLNVRLNYCAQPTRTKLPTPHLPHRYYSILTHLYCVLGISKLLMIDLV